MSYELKEALIKRILSAVFSKDDPEQIEHIVESGWIGVPCEQMVKEAPKFNGFLMQVKSDDVFRIAAIRSECNLDPRVPLREARWSSHGLGYGDFDSKTIDVPYVHTKTKTQCIMKIPVSCFPSVVKVVEYTKALNERFSERNGKIRDMYHRLRLLTPKQICSALNIKLETYILNDLKLTEDQIKTIQEKLQ